MGWHARRPVVGLALLAVVAVTAATAVRNEITDAGYVDVAETSCYPCHAGWSPPLRDIVTIVLPPGAEGAVGTAIELPVRIQHAWTTQKPLALERFEPSLDISGAPSLGFASNKDAVLGVIVEGLIPFQFDAGEPVDTLPVTERSAVVRVEVEAGVTDVAIRLRPQNEDPVLGPDLVMRIYVGKTTATGRPDVPDIDDAGPGAEEVFHLVGSNALSELGFGPWLVEAVQKPPTSHPSPTILSDTAFTVGLDKHYNATGETIQFLARDERVEPGGATVFAWQVVALRPPGPGEKVRIAANVTSYYEHDAAGTDDVAYTHDAIEVPVLACDQGVCFGDASDRAAPLDPGISLSRISEVIGYVSAFLVIASVYTGGVFGKASRRHLNGVFQSAKRRVAFHNFLSYGIVLAAFAHMTVFLWPLPDIESGFHWTQGILWGGVAMVAMLGLGVTGALQVPMIRRWSYAAWRWTHLGTAVAVMVFTVAHILLDGANFGEVQSTVGWTNPFDPRA